MTKTALTFEFEGVVGVGLLGVLFQALAEAADWNSNTGARFGVEVLWAAQNFGDEFVSADFAVAVLPQEDEQIAQDGGFAEIGMAGNAIKAWVVHFRNSVAKKSAMAPPRGSIPVMARRVR